MKNTTTNTSEQLTALYRTFIKSNSYVVYTFLSSDDVTRYTTTLNELGIATGCSCPGNATFHKFCRHMRAGERLEATRTSEQAQEVAPVVAQAQAIAASYSTETQRRNAPLNDSNRTFSLLR